jgi:hypothetical protein
MDVRGLLVGFVDGTVSLAAFRSEIEKRGDTLLAALGAITPDPPERAATLFLRLVDVRWDDAGAAYSLQGRIEQFLADAGIAVLPTSSYGDDHGALVRAQPRWLSLPVPYLQSLVDDLPGTATPAERSEAVERAIGARVWYLVRPPEWLQDAAWPMSDGVPAVFVGQLPVPGVYHDEAAVYVFRHAGSDRYETIVQVKGTG